MIQNVDLNDLKNQYLDNIEQQTTSKESLVESYHILYHIYTLKQEPAKAMRYALELDSMLSGLDRKKYLLEAVCVASVIGFQYIKYS